MNKMIERVAKNIGDNLYGYCDKNDTPNTWETAVGLARSAIKAMREPTEEMIKAGELIGVEYGYISDHDHKSIWQRQIDEILK